MRTLIRSVRLSPRRPRVTAVLHIEGVGRDALAGVGDQEVRGALGRADAPTQNAVPVPHRLSALTERESERVSQAVSE